MNLEKIANLIKNLRKKSGLTQSEFAEKYHVSYQAVSKWENAKSILKKSGISLDKVWNVEE